MPNQLPTLFNRNLADPFSMLRREMDDVFSEFGRRFRLFGNGETDGLGAPLIDVAETKDAYEITAELPGVAEKDVRVTLDRHGLTISGQKTVEREEKGKDWRVMERSEGRFRRFISLPFQAESNKVEATYKNGVLKVVVPKPAEAKAETKTIPVKFQD